MRKQMIVLAMVLVLAMVAGCQGQTPIRDMSTYETVEPTIPDSVPYPGVVENLDGGLQFYRNVYAWEDYTDAEIHMEEFKIESPNGLAPWIQTIDDELNAFVVFGGPMMNSRGVTRAGGGLVGDYTEQDPSLDIETDPVIEVDSFPLIEYQIRTGKQKELIRLAPNMYPGLLAVTDKYLIWTEMAIVQRSTANGSHMTKIYKRGIEGDSVLHVYVRDTGEDIPFTTPVWERIGFSGSGPFPQHRIVMREDSVYFDTYAYGVDSDRTDFSVFRFDILSRSLTAMGETYTNPVLYRDRVAWLAVGNADEQLTLYFEDEQNKGSSAQMTVPIPALDGVDAHYQSFGINGERIYVGDHGLGIRMIDEMRPQIPILTGGNPIANLINGYAGIAQYDATHSIDAFRIYLFDPDKSITARVDGIPFGIVPILNGQDAINLSSNDRDYKGIPVDTTKMMYMTSDRAPYNQDGYTLYWFDVEEIN